MTFIHAHRIGLRFRFAEPLVPGEDARVDFPDDVPVITDGTVTLRAHREDDVPALLEQATDPLMVAWTTVPVPSTEETSRKFATEVIPGGWRSDKAWAFAVEAVDDAGVPRFCGTVELRNEGDRRAEIAYAAHPWARGRGIILRALNVLLDWGFEQKQLETVIWWANDGNWASRKVAWRLGFSFDGTLRSWLPQRGELLDAWVGVLLSTDERAPRHPWLEVPRIVGQNVVLRAHESRDAERIREAGVDPRARHRLALPDPYTLEVAEAYIASRHEGHARGTALSWVAADPVTDALLANIALMDIKAGDDAEIGYWTHPEARGRGVMTEACRLVVRHAFIPEQDGGLGLKRLRIEASEGNAASRHVIEANGFVETGRHRESSRLGDGTWVDSITYDLLASEYSPPDGQPAT